jgi:glycosyltransferase involved in cell wall biosynthesis
VRLLILPEYDVNFPHVVVDTVFARMLPGLGHTVHMIRPVSGLRAVTCSPSPDLGGMMVGLPSDERTARRDFLRRLRVKLGRVREGLRRFDGVALDAVVVRNDLSSAVLARAFAARRRIPFVFQISSPEAEFRIHGRDGRLALNRWHHVVRGHMDLAVRRWVSRRSDAVLAISNAMRRHLIRADGLSANRVFAFPMGYGSNPDPTEADVQAARRDLSLTWSRSILYSGVIDGLREPEFMLDVLALVRKDVPDTGLVVLTYQLDDRRSAFESAARARGLPVRIVGPLHHARVAAYVRCADVVISSYPPRVEHAICSPTKSLEAIGAGVPVVGNEEVEEHRRFLSEAGGGIAVPYRAEAFSRAVVSLLRDEEKRVAMGAAGQQWAAKTRNYWRLSRYLDLILRQAVARGSLAALPHDPDDPAVDSLLEKA